MFDRCHVFEHSLRLASRARQYPSYFSHPYLLRRAKYGDSNSQRSPSLAIVGTRRPSDYGLRQTARLVRELAYESNKIQINSGGALGIDGAAHRAALNHGLRTQAWLVGPISRPSPQYHSRLFAEILGSRGGALWVPEVLEPSGGEIFKSFWVLRNYWLVAASDAVLVVEASESSGTWWTVKAASEMGVPVFALPGPVDTPQSKGTNQMIAMGYAHPVACVENLTKCLLVDFVKDSYNLSIEGDFLGAGPELCGKQHS
jgi:DNA protecting protein DprA